MTNPSEAALEAARTALDANLADTTRDIEHVVALALDAFAEKRVEKAMREATLAWMICASIHREYAKGKDPFYSTRHADFVKHEADCREGKLP